MSIRMLRETVGENEFEELLRLLKFLGVSTTESRVYFLLLAEGPMSVRQISDRLNIAMSKIYTAVENLEKRGWVYKGVGRPAKIHPTKISEIWKFAKERMQSMMNSIEEKVIPVLQSFEEDRESMYKIRIIRGEHLENVVRRLMFGRDEEIKVSIGEPSIVTRALMEALIYAARWKKLRVILPPEMRDEGQTLEQLGAQVKHKKVFGGGVIASEVVLFVRMGNETVGLWSDHGFFRYIADAYFDKVWSEES